TADTGAVMTRTKDVEEDAGYGLYLKDGKIQANLILRWLDDGARVETVKPVELNRWQHVMMTYDGSRTAEGIEIYVDGRPQELTVYLEDRKSTRLNSSHVEISYAVFCLKKKK